MKKLIVVLLLLSITFFTTTSLRAEEKQLSVENALSKTTSNIGTAEIINIFPELTGPPTLAKFGVAFTFTTEFQIDLVQYRYENVGKPFKSEWITLFNRRFNAPGSDVGPESGVPIGATIPAWPGNNIVSVRALVNGEFISATDEEEFVGTEEPLLIDNLDGMTFSYDEIGGFLDAFDFISPEFIDLDPNDFEFTNTLVTENDDFLDEIDYQILNNDILDSNEELLFQVETGYNQLTIGYNPPFSGFNYDIDEITIFVEGSEPQPEDLVTLTEFTDFWLAEADGQGGFETQERIDFTGFVHDTPAGDKVLQGDLNEDGVDDFLTVTRFNTTWSYTLPPSSDGLQEIGVSLIHDEAINATVLLGDLDQRGIPDILQITEDEILISRTETYYEYPTPRFLQDNPFTFDPDNGFYLTLEDMTADGDLDLVQVRPNPDTMFGEVFMMEFMQTKFDDPVMIGRTNSRWDPDGGWNIVFGDFNGDGLTDIAQNTTFRDVWVALAVNELGTLAPETRWAETGYRIDTSTTSPQWGYAARIDNSGRDHLILINDIGEVWIGDPVFDQQTQEWSFTLPRRSTALGFLHQYDGRWQSYFGDFTN